MKVIVFGATGSVGKLAVEDMLRAGYQVTAFARSPTKLNLEHDRLERISGDAFSYDDVAGAVAGHDAVVITLGAGFSRTSRVRSMGTLNIIRAMQQLGIRRLICQSTLGTFETWDNLNFFWKYVMFGFLLRPVFLDHQVQEQMVRASGLDWTIVRPSALSDDPVGDVRQNFGPQERNLSLKINRQDVAKFLTAQLEKSSDLHRAVSIST